MPNQDRILKRQGRVKKKVLRNCQKKLSKEKRKTQHLTNIVKNLQEMVNEDWQEKRELKRMIEKQARELEEIDEDSKCMICLTQKKTHCFQCGHRSCEKCAKKWKRIGKKKCHVCRKRIKMIIKLR